MVEIPGLGGLDALTLTGLLLAGFVAGWVDAVVGGGGLVQLPALLITPGLSPVQALATNKLGSVMGTSAAATTYLRRVRVDPRAAVPACVCAVIGAGIGAQLATLVPGRVLTPLILVVLVGVAVFTMLRHELGALETDRAVRHPVSMLVLTWVIGFVIGVYDGMFGPGTGTFLVILLVAVIGHSFVGASALAKIVNLSTNLGALAVFAWHGSVIWVLGLGLGLANAIGGVLGARTALRRGSGFVRVIFLVVVGALCLRLGWQLVEEWMAAVAR